ncbi:MAG TPA: HepT-like ribonuclease domain-containing protein [Thermoplasmata archaeon]|nr:HepT-like ribonuclease domain-containing protein [Thermoplasmata archaeon]
MTRHPRDDALRLSDIVAATRLIASYIVGGEEKFLGSTMAQDAVIRELEVIGEAAGNVSSRVQGSHPEVPWRAMRGFASFSKHEYWRVEPRRVWNAAVECESIGTAIARIRTD